jgi:hypothetical protein
MLGDIDVEDASGADLPRDENVQRSEGCGRRNEKVAGNDGFRIFGDEGPRLDDYESIAPIKKTRQSDHCQTRGLCYAARLYFPLLEERELPSEK